MTESREAEYSRLANQVAEIERLMQSGARSDAGYLLAPFLENARSRLDQLQSDEAQTVQDKKEQKEKETMTASILVEREQNLTAREKEQYGEFLRKDFFTRKDFGALEQFYADGGAWDRLSEGGRAEMSHRVWEGVRREEYAFEELPEDVRKKEAERLYQQLTGKLPADPSLGNIPEQDRTDFIREHEAGNEKAASRILSRESFSKNVSTHSSKEASKMDASSFKEKDLNEKAPEVKAAVGAEEDAAIGGVTFAAAGSVPATRLPVVSGGTIERS